MSSDKLKSRYLKAIEKHNKYFQQMEGMGIPKEELVYLYLSGNTLDIITTMNARELLHFISLRSCERAQWEVRNIAIEMLTKAKRVVPIVMKDAGPACVSKGFCPEGKMSCGKQEEKKEFFCNL